MRKNEYIKHIVLITLFSIILTSCLKDDPLKIPFQSYSPQNLADGWKIAEPDDVEIDEEALKEVYRYVHEDGNLWQIRSLLVFRDNKLVAESYMKNPDERTTPRAIWSCTKQVLGILAGIAVDKGLISVDDTLSDYFPQQAAKHPEKSMITIENLLMMKSGINYKDSGEGGSDAEFALEKISSSIDYILGLKMHSSPGSQFRYKSSDPHLLSAIIQEATGKTTHAWAQEVLFDKIGITKLEWLKYKDGITMGAWGIKTIPRELAKFGQLVLNEGMWGSERIVSKNWIDEMISVKVSVKETENHGLTFGYMWWKDPERNVNLMIGRGGQFVFINKDKNLLVVITSETNTDDDFNLAFYDAMPIYDRINSIAR